MATTTKDRELLKSVYPGKKWADKVDKMSEGQVVAVIMRLRAQNKIK